MPTSKAKNKPAPKPKEVTLNHIHEHLLNFALQFDEIFKQLSFIKKQNQKIMANQADLQAKIDELSGKVDSMQQTIDSEQSDIAALLATNAQVVSDLTAQRDALQAIIDAGGTGVDLQPQIDSINAVIAKVDAASADVASTV